VAVHYTEDGKKVEALSDEILIADFLLYCKVACVVLEKTTLKI
jgi:hypothetical protein